MLFVALVASLVLGVLPGVAGAAAPAVSIGYPVAIYNDTAIFSGLTGTASTDSSLVTVRVWRGTGVSGSPLMSITTPRMSGNWYTVQSPSLAAGTYTARAEQSDNSGNIGYSPAATFEITSTAGGSGGPAPADTSAPSISLGGQPSTSTDATPTFTGTGGTASGDSAAVTVRVYAGAGVAGSLVQTLTATRDGTSGAYAVNASSLAAGTYTARAEQSDTAGNVGYSAATSFAISAPDATAPLISLTAPPPSSSDATPTLAGTAGSLAGDSTLVTVRVYSGSSVGGSLVQSLSATRSASGSYSIDAAALPAGTFTARAEQGDAGGNVGHSPAVTFTITGAADTAAPGVTIGNPVALYNDTAVFSGLTGGAAGDSSLITVRVYNGPSISGSPLMSITTPRMSGNWYTIQSPSLAAGTYTARAEQGDAAGNIGYSPAATFTISSANVPPSPAPDTTAPHTTIGSGPGSVTTSTSASFSFTGSDETSAAGALSFQCSLDGGGFAACSSIKTYGGLALGVHSFAVRAIDEAGNVDASPAQSSWTVIAVSDTTPPTAPGSLSATAGNAQVSLSWSASTDNVAVTGYRVYQGSTLVSSPTGRSATVTGLTNGTSYSFTVKAIDAAGNLSAASNTASATPVAPVAAACADGLDNDADGKIDYPADPGCASASDTDETDVATARRYFGTEPVGTAGIPRSNSYCADHILRSSWEPRPGNTQYNAPRQDQASPYDSWWSSFPAWLTLRAQVDGGFVNSDGSRPTTTEIFSFAACKWGIDEDLIRAAAVQETGWDQRAIGDVCGANPTGTGQGSFSILQIKNRNCSNEGDWGGYPRTYDSTTYAADFYGAAFRGCMNDDFWYPTVTDQTTLVWGCVGAWFSGGWDPNQSYVVSVKKWLANRTWTSY